MWICGRCDNSNQDVDTVCRRCTRAKVADGRHPMRRCRRFADVLNSHEDQVAVRTLLERHVAPRDKAVIVAMYNDHVDFYNNKVAELQQATGRD